MSDTAFFYCDSWDAMLEPNESSEEQLRFSLINHSAGEVREVAKPLGKLKTSQQTELQAKASVRPNNGLCNEYDNFELREKLYEHCYSKKLVLFAPHAIVNKTNVPLKFGASHNLAIQLDPHSSCLFNVATGTKLSFKAPGFGTFPFCDI